MFKNLAIKLWNDECGAVIATEYLMLGSIVAVGGASGMVAMRDGVVDEYKDFGNSVREVRQANTPPVKASQPANAKPAANGQMVATNIPAAPTAQNAGSICPAP